MYFYLSKILSPFLSIVNLLFLLSLVFFFIKRLKKASYILIICLCIITLLPIGSLLEYHFLSKNFYGNKNDKNFDSILILGGDEKRILHGLSIWSQNKNAKIIFAGGVYQIMPTENQKRNSETSNFKNIIQDIIDEKNYIILKNSRNTFENLLSFKEFNDANNFQKTVIVTSPWHYKRVFAISNKLKLRLIPYLWKREPKKKIIHYYQSLSFANNLATTEKFFREIVGIISLYFLNA